MKKRLLAALMAGAMALTMTACGGSSSGSDDSNAASGSDSGSAGSYKVGIVQLVQHEALDAATQGFQDKLRSWSRQTAARSSLTRRTPPASPQTAPPS